MKNIRIILAASIGAILWAGCASQTIKTEESVPGFESTRKTEIHVWTFWDSKSELTKPKATISDKTTTSSSGSTEASASGTNAVQVLQNLDSILKRLGL